jgi:hypothetical protein
MLLNDAYLWGQDYIEWLYMTRAVTELLQPTTHSATLNTTFNSLH